MATSVKAFFDEKVPAVLATNPEKAQDVAAVYLFKIAGADGGTWTVDLGVVAALLQAGRARYPAVHGRGDRRRLPRHDSTAACRPRCRCSSAAS